MRTIIVNIFSCCLLLLTACSKNDAPVALSAGSVSIQTTSGKDTVQMAIPIASDSTQVIGLQAVLADAVGSDHWVTFKADTTKLAAFRAVYGNADLLPTSCYYFYKSTARIAAGSTVSDSAQLNIILQTKLDGYATYVLPLVIQSVDGNPDGIATSQVVYYVLKTGKPSVIPKTSWTIAGVSSTVTTSTAYAATNVLDDNNTTTSWASDLTQAMPQWVAINFNKSVTFSSVVYYFPTTYKYPTLGGYPTSIQLETSLDGTNWVNKGVFAGNIVNNMQVISLGLTTARYLRFTGLSSVKYNNTYETIFISGIGVLP